MKLPELKGAGELILAVIIAIASFFLSPWLAENFAPLGYLGVFIFSIVSSATIFLPVPSWIMVFSLSGSLNPLILGITAGVGSGLGELTGYFAGRGGTAIVGADKFSLLNSHKKWIAEAEFLTLFVVSFLPNPFFDIAGIAAGIMKVQFWHFLIAVVLGKTARFILFAYFGFSILNSFGFQ